MCEDTKKSLVSSKRQKSVRFCLPASKSISQHSRSHFKCSTRRTQKRKRKSRKDSVTCKNGSRTGIHNDLLQRRAKLRSMEGTELPSKGKSKFKAIKLSSITSPKHVSQKRVVEDEQEENTPENQSSDGVPPSEYTDFQEILMESDLIPVRKTPFSTMSKSSKDVDSHQDPVNGYPSHKESAHVASASHRSSTRANVSMNQNVLEICSHDPNAYKFRNRKPHIHTNIFFLLSKYGSTEKDCGLHLFTSGRENLVWSSEQYYYLCGIGRDGSPWLLRSAPDVKKIAKVLLRRSTYSTNMERNKKILDINMIGDVTKFMEEEWESYIEHRFSTLQYLGRYAVETRVKLYQTTTDEKNIAPRQGLVWKNNSCAYDAFFSILPHVAIAAVLEGISDKKIFNRNAIFFSPVAILTAAFDVLEIQTSDPTIVSDWIRQLGTDILSRWAPGCMKARNISWSPFVEDNAYSDIGDIQGTMEIFFRLFSDNSFHLCAVNVLELPSSFLFHEAKMAFNRSHSTTLPDLIFKTLLAFKSESRHSIIEPALLSVSLEFLQGLQGTRKSGLLHWFSTLFMEDCRKCYDFSKDDCRKCYDFSNDVVASNLKGKWDCGLLAMVGSSAYHKEHFVSATYHYSPKPYFLFHDGMEANGCLRLMSIQDVVQNKIALENVFLTLFIAKHKSTNDNVNNDLV